jgi:signal transduction histidine kinase
MVVMALGLIVLVMGFFWGMVVPVVHGTLDRVVHDYSRRVAAGAPGRAAAEELSERIGLEIRYEGPGGGWSTAPGLPTLAEVRRAQQARWSVSRLDYRVVPAPQGGSYVFVWDYGGRMMLAHHRMLAVLLLVMAGIVLAAHLVLRRLLLPLRALGDAVARLGEGELDLELPPRRRDEIGALTEAFNAMARRVREMIRARDRLLLDVSHDLRSPLTRLKVALELQPPGERRTRMAADVAEMEAMVTELLELERLRDGRALRRERRDLMPIVREVAATFAGRPPGVRVQAPPRPFVLEVDGEKLRAVLRNLLDNAYAHALSDSRPVEVAVSAEPGAVVVRVRDDGPGVPEADLDSLFEPFFRGDPARSRRTASAPGASAGAAPRTAGYGLGLSICKRTVEAHGGTLAVANNLGRGATFTLRLPAAEEAGDGAAV